MKKRILAIVLCISMVLPCMACNNDTESPVIKLPYETERAEDMDIMETETEEREIDVTKLDKDDEEKVSIAATDFAVRLLQAEGNTVFFNSGGGMNRLISPLSVLTAMSMVVNGAENETKEQMEAVLGISIESLNPFIAKYRSELQQENGNCFHMANSIWFTEDESFTVQEDFLNINKKYYGADIYETMFDQNVVRKINQWVETNTDGLIKEVLNEIPEDAVMYLINALVFDAKWENPYTELAIQDAKFKTSEGIEQEIELMYSTENLYLEDAYATGFIKYYEGRDYAFVALLPNENTSLPVYISTLSGESLHEILESPQSVKVDAWLPQFEVSYQTELCESLKTMGMHDVFDSERADLSGIGISANGNLSVDRVIHKTYMEVSPIGTKAGAATVVEAECGCAFIEPEEIKEVRLDRPFLYMIIDCKNSQPIFMGTVNAVNPYRCGVIDEELCGYPRNES